MNLRLKNPGYSSWNRQIRSSNNKILISSGDNTEILSVGPNCIPNITSLNRYVFSPLNLIAAQYNGVVSMNVHDFTLVYVGNPITLSHLNRDDYDPPINKIDSIDNSIFVIGGRQFTRLSSSVFGRYFTREYPITFDNMYVSGRFVWLSSSNGTFSRYNIDTDEFDTIPIPSFNTRIFGTLNLIDIYGAYYQWIKDSDVYVRKIGYDDTVVLFHGVSTNPSIPHIITAIVNINNNCKEFVFNTNNIEHIAVTDWCIAHYNGDTLIIEEF